MNFGKGIYNNYIFFTAPYYYKINYNSIDDEIKSLYGDIDMKNKVFIRVDPNQTYVFSFDIRVKPLKKRLIKLYDENEINCLDDPNILIENSKKHY
jgi:hypothetical protein